MKPSDNDLMCRVGPGNAMHDLLREYWIPALRAASLVPGAAPTKVRLMGEDYVAFRDQDGQIGFVADACPHRGVTLSLARNEPDGLRCIFHGWKINAQGSVVDVPTEPAERTNFGCKVEVQHHPVREAAGIVWVHLGSSAPTRFPAFGFTELPEAHVQVMAAQMHCNWVQCIEGGLDSSHVSMLHSSELENAIIGGQRSATADLIKTDTAPRYEIEAQPYGFRAAALRAQGDGTRFVRVSEFIMPWYVLVPAGPDDDCLMIMVVPVDDTHSVQWFVYFNAARPIDDQGIAGHFARNVDRDPDDWRGSVSAERTWGQDRDVMVRGHWSGIRSVYFEDVAVQEAAGELATRAREHLGSSDAAVIRLRRTLLDAARAHQGAHRPPSLGDGYRFDEIAAVQGIVGEGQDWRSLARAASDC